MSQATPTGSVRALRVDEAADVTDFLWRTFVATYGHVGSPENLELLRQRAYQTEIQQRDLAGGQIEHWLIESPIANRGNAWAGLCQLRLNTPPPDCVSLRPALEVGRFYFDSQFQGTGLAARLMEHVKQRARALGAQALWLSVWKQAEQAIRFYRKQGYEPVGSTTYWYGDEPKDDWVMSWRVD